MFEVINNFLHLLAAAVWLGGAIFIHIVLNPSLKLIDPQQGGIVLGSIGKRFSITAWSSYLVLIITGYIKTPDGMLLAFDSDFGMYLSIKHIAMILLILSGLVIALYIVPRMRAAMPKGGEKPADEFIRRSKQLHNFALFNTLLGIFIFLLSSLLW
jgi:copper resistance protein D